MDNQTDVQKVTINQAAKELGYSSPTIRYLMQEGLLPIGHVLKRGKKNTYIILRTLLNEFKREKDSETEQTA